MSKVRIPDLRRHTITEKNGRGQTHIIEIEVMRWRPVMEMGDGYFYSSPGPVGFVVGLMVIDAPGTRRTVTVRSRKLTLGVVYQVGGLRSEKEAGELIDELVKGPDWEAWDFHLRELWTP